MSVAHTPLQSATPPMKVQKQITLPLSKAIEISLKSIKIRLSRSIITASGIMLGIAFFSSVYASRLFPVKGTSAEAIAAAHRQDWLAVMALLVCFVGIMNAMLMSVTERFKEIGTMKCLGALDRFVVTLFIIEAGFLGIISSSIGWFVGWLITSTVHIFTDGPRAFGGGFWLGTLGQLAISVGIGVVITLLAAIPPAYRAAKMPPVAALRTEI
jgi:putative ABC transport system permease protein